jgi:phage gpG-like protein
MREFSLLGFVEFLGTLHIEVEHANHEALELGARIIEEEAKRVIGTYDYGWPRLAESTLKRKSDDTPLLETGEMRDSIEHVSSSKEAHIGSNNDKAIWQELGTKTIPPRSFLAGAAMHKEREVVDLIGRAAVLALSGETVVGANLLRRMP